MNYKSRKILKEKYDELGSTRKVGKRFGVSNGTIVYWMRKFCIPRIPKLYFGDSNSARARRGELYIVGHPYFKKDVFDYGTIDDKARRDITWRADECNVKTSHYKRAIFRIKKKRHNVRFYICLHYGDTISPLMPIEIWIIPSSVAPYSNITPGIVREDSKYHKFKLSLLRDKEFSRKEEVAYNKWFEKKYRKYLPSKKRDLNGKK